MSHPISTLGVLHTAISLVPIAAGLYAFARFGGINTTLRSGKVYLAGLTLAVVTSLGVSSSGGLNPAHLAGVVVLVAAFGGALAPKLGFLGRLKPYMAAFGLSFSFLLSLVPGTNETLTRLPVSHPLATGPDSPAVVQTLLVWLVLFVIGYIAQCRAIYQCNKSGASTGSWTAFGA